MGSWQNNLQMRQKLVVRRRSFTHETKPTHAPPSGGQGVGAWTIKKRARKRGGGPGGGISSGPGQSQPRPLPLTDITILAGKQGAANGRPDSLTCLLQVPVLHRTPLPPPPLKVLHDPVCVCADCAHIALGGRHDLHSGHRNSVARRKKPACGAFEQEA